jgi:hypothetical protein
MAAFRGNPALAYKDKALIFSRHHDEVFASDVRVEEVLFCWVCGEACKTVIWEMIKVNAEDARILKKGGTLFTLAVLSEIVRARNGATCLSSMKEDNITSAKARDRLRKYAKYSAMLYLSAVRDEIEIQKVELTTLIRQRDLFEKVLRRIRSQYEKDSLNSEWLKGALPDLKH